MVERIKSVKHIILFYYLVIGLIILLFRSYAQIDLSLNKEILTILIVYFILFPLVIIYTLRYALHIFLFSLAFITGFYGFYNFSVDNHSISNALYFTFCLYLLNLADVFTADGSSPTKYPLLLEIARWTAASYTITTIFIAMYRSLEKKIALFIAQTYGNHHIIFSYNEKSHYLIQDLRANKQRVIVVDEKFTPETKSMLEEMKVIVIQASEKDNTVFQNCGVKKAKSISLFHLNDQASLFVLMELEKYVRAKNINFTFDKVMIQLEDNRYKRELLSFLEKVEHFTFPVEVIDVYEEIAKKFWRNHSEIIENNQEAHLLVVGYQMLGEQLVSVAKDFYQAVHESKAITFTILDEFPEEVLYENIEKIPFQVEKDSLENIIVKHPRDFTHIFICLPEAYLDLMEGIQLSEAFPETPIYMNFSDERIEQTFLISTTKTKKTLFSIGTVEEVLTKKYLNL